MVTSVLDDLDCSYFQLHGGRTAMRAKAATLLSASKDAQSCCMKQTSRSWLPYQFLASATVRVPYLSDSA